MADIWCSRALGNRYFISSDEKIPRIYTQLSAIPIKVKQESECTYTRFNLFWATHYFLALFPDQYIIFLVCFQTDDCVEMVHSWMMILRDSVETEKITDLQLSVAMVIQHNANCLLKNCQSTLGMYYLRHCHDSCVLSEWLKWILKVIYKRVLIKRRVNICLCVYVFI